MNKGNDFNSDFGLGRHNNDLFLVDAIPRHTIHFPLFTSYLSPINE